jgi:glycosyltransferase involved in cell wall biosynthesis
VSRYLSVADAALVNLRRLETFRTVIRSKIFEAAAMRKPILLGVDGQAREIVEQYEAGLFFEPENGDDFLSRMRELASKKELYARLQEGCGTLAADYDRKKLADAMMRRLTLLV